MWTLFGIVLVLLVVGKILYHAFDDGAVQIRYTPERHEPGTLADVSRICGRWCSSTFGGGHEIE